MGTMEPRIASVLVRFDGLEFEADGVITFEFVAGETTRSGTFYICLVSVLDW